jgi:hypothetical protein
MFQKPLETLGEQLDRFFNDIAFESIPEETKTKSEDIIIKNEILSVFNKSKINTKQFAPLLMKNNVYIVNEQKGDWTRLKTYEIEEMMNNIKHEIDDDKDKNTNPKNQYVNYKTSIRQKFDIKMKE